MALQNIHGFNLHEYMYIAEGNERRVCVCARMCTCACAWVRACVFRVCGGEIVNSVSCSEFSISGGGADSNLGLRYDGYAVIIEVTCWLWSPHFRWSLAVRVNERLDSAAVAVEIDNGLPMTKDVCRVYVF